MLILRLNNQLRLVSEHNMKVKLLRATMIAGTPTSVGTIVDVEQQTGQYLIAVEKAELYVEVCEAPIPSTNQLSSQSLPIVTKLIFLK